MILPPRQKHRHLRMGRNFFLRSANGDGQTAIFGNLAEPEVSGVPRATMPLPCG